MGRNPESRAIGPAWTRGKMEPPAGERDMGGWVARVYTDEQQKRLGIDENGKKVDPTGKRTVDVKQKEALATAVAEAVEVAVATDNRGSTQRLPYVLVPVVICLLFVIKRSTK